MRGFIQVYTGNGKGKTTAALGLAIRAAGAGMHVYIGQFLKMGDYSEINSLKRFDDLIEVEQFGLGHFTNGKPTVEDIAAARRGVERVTEVLESRRHQVVILEEANVAVRLGLIGVQELIGLILKKPYETELVITGRGAHSLVLDSADLVTEMRDVKHYFQKGVKARRGIEK